MQIAVWYQDVASEERESEYEKRLSDVEKRIAAVEEELRIRDRRRWKDEDDHGPDSR